MATERQVEPKVEVIHILTGERAEMYAEPGYKGYRLYRMEHLTKKGLPAQNRFSDGSMSDKPDRYSYARFDTGREEKAQLVRARITELQHQMGRLEAELIALYD